MAGGLSEGHPGASWNEVIDASADARQATYAWLFDGSLDKQDTRIKILIEQDAFQRIWENWREYGYPFGHLVPSLGTAIGASGDRPDALAELMGILLNDTHQRAAQHLHHLMRHDAVRLGGALHDCFVRRTLGEAQALDRDRWLAQPVAQDDAH